MTRSTPLRSDVLAAFATEITSVYPARAIVAIMADDPAESERFGRDLAAAVAASGRTVATARSFGDLPTDAVSIVVGPAARDEAAAGSSHVRVWLDHGRDDDRALRRSTGVVFDVTDPEHPRRRFADSC